MTISRATPGGGYGTSGIPPRGKPGEEPPKEIKDLYDTHKKFMNAKSGSPESKAALDAIYKSYQDNVWTFNVVEDTYYPTFVTKKNPERAGGPNR